MILAVLTEHVDRLRSICEARFTLLDNPLVFLLLNGPPIGVAGTPRAGEKLPSQSRGEDNANAHLKRQIMGREAVVAITNGRLDFEPWEQIFYGEFDGGRRKRVLVKIIGE